MEKTILILIILTLIGFWISIFYTINIISNQKSLVSKIDRILENGEYIRSEVEEGFTIIIE